MKRLRHCLWIASSAFGLLAMTMLIGCIRLTGGAGFWHKGPNDESPKTKQIGFDTNDYIPGTPAPGNITTEEK